MFLLDLSNSLKLFSTFELSDLIQDEYELTYDFEFLVFDLLSQKL